MWPLLIGKCNALRLEEGLALYKMQTTKNQMTNCCGLNSKFRQHNICRVKCWLSIFDTISLSRTFQHTLTMGKVSVLSIFIVCLFVQCAMNMFTVIRNRIECWTLEKLMSNISQIKISN